MAQGQTILCFLLGQLCGSNLGHGCGAAAMSLLPYRPRYTPFSWKMDILLPWFLKRAVQKKRPLVFERLIPRAFILADFCAANNLHRILLSLLPIRLSTHGVSLFTIVRLIAAFAWLTPSYCLYLSQNDHRTRERRHGNRGNSTIWQSSPPYRFVNRGSTFMDTENFNFSHFEEICMILFPFHADTPCVPHYSGCVGSATKGMRLIYCGGAYPSSL